MNVSEISGTDLNPYIAKALGYVCLSTMGRVVETPNFHASGEIAMQLYSMHGESLQKFADGFYCTMRCFGKLNTKMAKDPITAIYRAYVASRLGEEV